MKLSSLLIGTLMIASVGAQSQEKETAKEVSKDSIKVVRKLDNFDKPNLKKIIPPDSVKTNTTDSTKVIPIKITRDICHGCGLG
jgi:hypothetical protein